MRYENHARRGYCARFLCRPIPSLKIEHPTPRLKDRETLQRQLASPNAMQISSKPSATMPTSEGPEYATASGGRISDIEPTTIKPDFAIPRLGDVLGLEVPQTVVSGVDAIETQQGRPHTSDPVTTSTESSGETSPPPGTNPPAETPRKVGVIAESCWAKAEQVFCPKVKGLLEQLRLSATKKPTKNNYANEAQFLFNQILSATVDKKKAMEDKQWIFPVRFGAHVVKIRDAFDKMFSNIKAVKCIGDKVASMDSVHAGTPWAAVSLIFDVCSPCKSLPYSLPPLRHNSSDDIGNIQRRSRCSRPCF